MEKEGERGRGRGERRERGGTEVKNEEPRRVSVVCPPQIPSSRIKTKLQCRVSVGGKKKGIMLELEWQIV